MTRSRRTIGLMFKEYGDRLESITREGKGEYGYYLVKLNDGWEFAFGGNVWTFGTLYQVDCALLDAYQVTQTDEDLNAMPTEVSEYIDNLITEMNSVPLADQTDQVTETAYVPPVYVPYVPAVTLLSTVTTAAHETVLAAYFVVGDQSMPLSSFVGDTFDVNCDSAWKIAQEILTVTGHDKFSNVSTPESKAAYETVYSSFRNWLETVLPAVKPAN